MITIEKIDEAWAAFDNYKAQAEQHEFAKIFFMDRKLTPLYNDLHRNWDEGHALIFMRGMRIAATLFGFECPDFEGEVES